MTTIDSLFYQQPAMVEITRRDGRRAQLVFATRLEAEAYIALIPLLQVMGEGGTADIADAIITPLLVGVN